MSSEAPPGPGCQRGICACKGTSRVDVFLALTPGDMYLCMYAEKRFGPGYVNEAPRCSQAVIVLHASIKCVETPRLHMRSKGKSAGSPSLADLINTELR